MSDLLFINENNYSLLLLVVLLLLLFSLFDTNNVHVH